jgi:hypothetical protein
LQECRSAGLGGVQRLAEDAEPVVAGEFVKGAGRETGGAEGGDQVLQAGGVADGGGDGGAVEVGAERDAVFAEAVDEVGEVLGDAG